MTSSSLSKHGPLKHRARALWLAGLCLVALPLPAHAFSDPAKFGLYPEQEGGLGAGGGRFFTGSPADGYGCSVCHTAKEAYSFPVNITGLPKNGYIPGKTYTVKLTWPEATQQFIVATQRGNHPLSSVNAEFISEGGGSSGTLQFQSRILSGPDDSCSPELARIVHNTDDDDTATTAAPAMMGTPGAPAPTGPEYEFAGHLFVANRGAQVFEAPIGGSCDISDDPERRCIATTRPCGAKQLVLKWTAPSKWKSPIWFSLGFVMTYDTTSRPDDNDYVTEIAIPLNPASEGATYESELEGGCSVAGPRGGRADAGLFGAALLVCASVLGLRRRRRAPAAQSGKGRSWWLLATLGLFGCQTDPALGSQTSDLVGKFEPGPLGKVDAGLPVCMRKVSMNLVEDPSYCSPDKSAAGSGGGSSCVGGGAGSGAVSSVGLPGLGSGAAIDAAGAGGASGGGAGAGGASFGAAGAGSTLASSGAAGMLASSAGTSAPMMPVAPMSTGGAGGAGGPLPRGMLDVSFTTMRDPAWPPGGYDATFTAGPPPPDYGTVWITDSKGGLVKTLERWGIDFWYSNQYEYVMRFPCDIDVMGHATAEFSGHKPHAIHWDGHNFDGKLALDGDYILWILVQADEDPAKHLPPVQIKFTKGRMPFTMQVPSTPPHTGLTVTYTPQ